MNQLQAVKAEIERLIERAKAERILHPKTILAAKDYLLIEDYNKLLSFIESLEQEQITGYISNPCAACVNDKGCVTCEHYNMRETQSQGLDEPSYSEVMETLNQVLIDWRNEAKTEEEKESRFEAHKRFFEIYDEAMMVDDEPQGLDEAAEKDYAKLKELADNMYSAAQYLTDDASMLHKAMEEYKHFVVYEYNKKEEKE